MVGNVLVIDIGKTNAKLALVATAGLREVEVLSRPNRVLPGPPYPHADTEGVWQFVLEGMRELQARHRIGAVVATTHGATAALVDAAGLLALPVLDYEHDGPEVLAAEYDAARPDFAESGSPRLGAGLNLGAQIFWQARAHPEEFARVAAILPYPQYWALRLSGVAASEVTSLGAHSDLWAPGARGFSSLVAREGWDARMPPLRRAAERLGPVTAEVVAATGVDPATPVFCGIHDSNASLLPHLLARAAPFAVVSTGTWVIAMAVGGRAVTLDPARDTLINVDAFGDPVPSARFMGGREWALVTAGRGTAMRPEDAEAVLVREVMLFPAVEGSCGPFQGRRPGWWVPEAEIGDGERAVAASWYLALVTAECLGMIGAEGPVCVEGPFAANPAFLDMAAAATGRPVLVSDGVTGTSLGAALLTLEKPKGALLREAAVHLAGQPPERLAAYAARWRERVMAHERAQQ
jgi:sugar (pentulose or hexulose) kinase